jgi:hypothetical protein
VNDDDPAGRGLPDDATDDHPDDDAAGHTDDLRRYAGTPSAGVRVLRAIRVPGVLLLIGIALTIVGPLPGLGVFLVIGAALATFVVGMTALVGR